MPDASGAHVGPAALSEDAAHRLLARAVELDARRASDVSIAQLREIAREAGIAPAAFDEALTEICGLSEAGVAPPKAGLLQTVWRRWQGTESTGAVAEQPTSLWAKLTTNVVAFAAFFMVLTTVNRLLLRPLALGWPAHTAALIAVNLLGVGVAVRLRARLTAVALGVTAAAQLAGYAMHLVFGIKTVQGGPTQWALMLAALFGIALGAVFTGSREPSAPTRPDGAIEPAVVPGQSNAPGAPPPSTLRLRTA